MRLYLIAILVGLSACATVPDGNDLGVRTASWIGAPASDLVVVLGQPEITNRGSWIWRFPGPGDGEVISFGGAHRLRPATSHVGGPTNSAGQPAQPGAPYGTLGTYHKHVVCKYIGYVENGIVTRLTTLSKPGTHCRFDELPPRSDWQHLRS